MLIPGIVTNITNFGAFVDIGVKQDGLVHISQLSDTYVSDPNQVVKLQQQVRVTVMDVDVARKRISLSMKGPAPAAGKPGAAHGGKSGVSETANRQGTDRPADMGKRKAAENNSPRPDPFQAKLLELKKKFKDR